MPEPQRFLSLGPVRIEVVRSVDGFLGMVEEGLSDFVPNPQTRNMGPPRPPQVVRSDVLKAGKFPELPVGVLELIGVLVPRREPPEQRTGAVGLGDSALDDFLDRPLQGDQEVFAVLGLGDLPDPLPVQGGDILGLDRGRFSRTAQRGQDQEVDVRRLLILHPGERLQDGLDLGIREPSVPLDLRHRDLDSLAWVEFDSMDVLPAVDKGAA